MKTLLLFTCISGFIVTTSCDNGLEATNIHTHEVGSRHTEHDTTKPAQQEFRVTDTVENDTSTHTHAGGKTHAH